MKVESIILDADGDRMVYHYEDGNREIKTYPPLDEADKKLVEEFGGHKEISLATYRYNRDLVEFDDRFKAFSEGMMNFSTNFMIDSIMAIKLTDEELMKLKLSIFEHEFVKNSANQEVLTSIRTSKDAVDLLMYFGMLRKEASA